MISAANGHFRNYATRHDNIRALLNTLLNSVEEMQRYALLIESFSAIVINTAS